MAQNTTPIFINEGLGGAAQMTTANPNRDGTGALVTVVTGQATDGSRLDCLIFQAVGIVNPDVVRIFYDDTSNDRLIDEILINTSISPTAQTLAWRYIWRPPQSPWHIQPGHEIKVASHIGNDINVIAIGGHY